MKCQGFVPVLLSLCAKNEIRAALNAAFVHMGERVEPIPDRVRSEAYTSSGRHLGISPNMGTYEGRLIFAQM